MIRVNKGGFYMKRYLLASILGLALVSPVFAADSVFDTVAPAGDTQKVEIAPINSKSVVKNEIPAVNKVEQGVEIQNANYEQAITSLDAAQVEIRDEYLQYLQKYNEAKARYDAAKAECKEYKKYVNQSKKKIDNLEKMKKNIGKNIK